MTYAPSAAWSVVGHVSRLERPLEFRFNDARVWAYGASLRAVPSHRWQLSVSATRYDEARRRPDAAQFDWDQLRVSIGVTVFVSSGAEPSIHPAILRIPTRRVFR